MQWQKMICVVMAAAAMVSPAWAGLEGQPMPTAKVQAELTKAVSGLARGGSDRAGYRSDLLLALEKEPSADVTDILLPALPDADTYRAIQATFLDALDAEKDAKKKEFLRYNIARIPLLAGRQRKDRNGQKAYADNAARAAEQLESDSRDPAVWELKGDIATLQENPNAAVAAYQKMATRGGSPTQAQLKTAQAWQSVRRWREAEAAYQNAIQRDTASPDGGKQNLHRIYQGLASLYMERGDFASAVNALVRSARVRQDETAPYRLRLDIARALLARGYKKEVATYAEAAVKLNPDDTEAAQLRASLSR